VLTQSFLEILRHLQTTGFRDLSGTRISGTVPVSERLINELVASAVRPAGPVREVRVQPLAGDAFSVRVAPRASLLPSITVRLEIDRQPELPASPVLVLRLATMGGLFGLAAAALPIAGMLPPGVRLDGDRILVDVRAIAADRGAGDLLEYVTGLRLNTEEGRVVLHLDLSIR
jgi:hypothetical protein